MKTIVSVDGFNLYYGCVKRTPYKWLNIQRMCELLLPNNKIVGLKPDHLALASWYVIRGTWNVTPDPCPFTLAISPSQLPPYRFLSSPENCQLKTVN